MATGGSKIVSLDSRVVCSVCLEPYKGRQPKLLPCFHTFCLHCLIDIQHAAQRQQNKSSDGTRNVSADDEPPVKISCPTCRKTTPVPPGGVSHFQTNFYVEGEAEVNAPPPSLCEFCFTESPYQFCTKCSSKFCRWCSKAHNKVCKRKGKKGAKVSSKTIDEEDTRSETGYTRKKGAIHPTVSNLSQILALLSEEQPEVAGDSGDALTEWRLKLEETANKATMLQTSYTLLCQTVTAVNEKNIKLTADLASMQTDLLTLQKSHGSLQADHLALQREMAAVQDKNIILCQEVAELQTSKTRLHQDVNDLHSDSSKLRQDIIDLQTDNTKQKQQLEIFEAENSKLRQELENLQAENTKLHQDLDNLSSKLRQDITDLQTDNTEQNQQLENLDAENSRLRQDLENLQAENAKLRQDLDHLQSDKTKQTEQLENLQVDIVKQKQQLENFQTENAKLLQNLDSFRLSSTKQNKQLENLQTDNAKLRQDLETLQTDNTRLYQQTENLQTDNAELRQNIANLQTNNAKLCLDLEGLEEDNTLLHQRLSTLQTNDALRILDIERLQRDSRKQSTRLKGLQGDNNRVHKFVETFLAFADNTRVAFHAVLSEAVTTYHKEETLVLDYVLSNIGGAYDNASGIFTAPSEGIYMFFASSGPNKLGEQGKLDIVTQKKGDVIGYVCGLGGHISSTHTVVHLDEGDKVWLRTYADGQYTFHGNWWTTFTGCFINGW